MAKTKGMLLVALLAFVSGCMTYRGPRGVEAALEDTLRVELRRELGIKLGPVSTRFAASLIGHDDEFDLHEPSRVSAVIYEVGRPNGSTPRPIEPRDLGATGFTTMLASKDGGEQVLVLVKPPEGEIREMMLLTVDAEEVLLARPTGRLDELFARSMNGAKRDGARGAREVIGFDRE
jgi:hypothetical protein